MFLSPGKTEYLTPQSQQVLEDGMGGAMMNVNIPQAMKHLTEMEDEAEHHEGCRMKGTMAVRRVAGRLHISVHQHMVFQLLPQVCLCKEGGETGKGTLLVATGTFPWNLTPWPISSSIQSLPWIATASGQPSCTQGPQHVPSCVRALIRSTLPRAGQPAGWLRASDQSKGGVPGIQVLHQGVGLNW